MNITGGSYKGRKVKTIKSLDVRPTSAKIRESIFNIIQSSFGSLEGTIMLDLFTGSGIMGLEALSRGVEKVVFVEKNRKVASLLKENLSSFDFQYELLNLDALAALDKLKGSKFDLIFIDPPYASGLYEPSLEKIKSNNLLNQDGIIIIEHSPKYNIEEIAEKLDFKVIKSRNYGDTSITIII